MDYLPERLAAAYTYVFHCYFLCCTPGSTEFRLLQERLLGRPKNQPPNRSKHYTLHCNHRGRDHYSTVESKR